MSAPRSVAVVSGCPDLGPACAGVFAERGDAVVLIGAGAAPADVLAVALDGSDEAGVAAALGAAVAANGPIEVLVTVPGPTDAVSLLRAGPDTLTDHLGAHLNVAYLAARQVAPAMVKARSGRIVLVSAISSLVGAGWEVAAGTSMAGLLGLCRSLARELAPADVTVNVVAAGAVETSHLAEVRAGGPRSAAMIDQAVANTPLKRLGTPADVAWAVEFLASPDASYLTGVILPVDGGLGMGFT